MTVTTTAFLLIGAAILTYLMTGLVRRHALRTAMIDIPNRRSSHATPTPRGGGLALAVVILASIVLFSIVDAIPRNVGLALGGGGALVAMIGWADDRTSQGATIRLFVHFLAAAWAVYWLHGLPSLRVGQISWYVGSLGTGLAVLGIMWATNLYNFMD